MKRMLLAGALLVVATVSFSFRPAKPLGVAAVFENHSNTSISYAWMGDNNEFVDQSPLLGGNKFAYTFTGSTIFECEADFSGSHPAGTLHVEVNGVAHTHSVAANASATACNISVSATDNVRVYYTEP